MRMTARQAGRLDGLPHAGMIGDTAIALLLVGGLGLLGWRLIVFTTAPSDVGDLQQAALALEKWRFALSVAGTVGAALAFWVGLMQYRRAQHWKRAEFLASELKDLFANPKVSAALTMLDWASRRIKLHAIENPEDVERTLVTIEMQCEALMPHTLPKPVSPSPEQEEQVRDGESMRRYSLDESIIRDCYDALFDGFDRLGSYLEGGLISAKDLRPYLGYWIGEIAAPTSDVKYALWCVCLLTYIHFYTFDGVPILFKRLGYDIHPDRKNFEQLVKSAGENAVLAESLRMLAKNPGSELTASSVLARGHSTDSSSQ
jgi:hypothetical protein